MRKIEKAKRRQTKVSRRLLSKSKGLKSMPKDDKKDDHAQESFYNSRRTDDLPTVKYSSKPDRSRSAYRSTMMPIKVNVRKPIETDQRTNIAMDKLAQSQKDVGFELGALKPSLSCALELPPKEDIPNL